MGPNPIDRTAQKLHAVQRLMAIEDVCEVDARMLVDVLGVDWSSLKRESDLMKKAALPPKILR
jgi:hypothetical protein